MTEGRRLRIRGDGTWYGTRVEDAETGEKILGVVGVTMRLAHDEAIVDLTVLAERCNLDVAAELRQLTAVCAHCGAAATIGPPNAP